MVGQLNCIFHHRSVKEKCLVECVESFSPCCRRNCKWFYSWLKLLYFYTCIYIYLCCCWLYGYACWQKRFVCEVGKNTSVLHSTNKHHLSFCGKETQKQHKAINHGRNSSTSFKTVPNKYNNISSPLGYQLRTVCICCYLRLHVFSPTHVKWCIRHGHVSYSLIFASLVLLCLHQALRVAGSETHAAIEQTPLLY